jgi:CubicO group peptidase (beta-lactamase class C family)
MFRFKSFLLILLLTFFVSGCDKDKKFSSLFSRKKTPISYAMKPSEEEFPKLSDKFINDKKREIDNFFTNIYANNFENISFLVAQNGQIIYEKYDGFADKEKNILNSAETPLHIASISKVFTASAILKLVEAKKIGLDQKLTTLFKEFPYPEVTIRTLLNHRSGLKKYGYFTEDKTIWDNTKMLTNKDILTILCTKNIPLDHPTNTHFVYNNTNYALLALVIEKATGMKYPKAMKEIIFDPLDMKNTYVFDYKSDKNKAIPSYKWNYEKYPFDYLDAVYGDKNIYSTPRDMLKFDLARNAPSFLKKELVDQVFKGYSYESKGIKNYGLGIRMREWENGIKLLYHNGWWHGNTSSYITLRKEHAVIIALSNKFSRKTYQVKRLSVLFGDYPFTLSDTTATEE